MRVMETIDKFSEVVCIGKIIPGMVSMEGYIHEGYSMMKKSGGDSRGRS